MLPVACFLLGGLLDGLPAPVQTVLGVSELVEELVMPGVESGRLRLFLGHLGLE